MGLGFFSLEIRVASFSQRKASCDRVARYVIFMNSEPYTVGIIFLCDLFYDQSQAHTSVHKSPLGGIEKAGRGEINVPGVLRPLGTRRKSRKGRD